MAASHITAGIVLLGLSCGAQQARGGGGQDAAASTAANDAAPSVVHDLYRQAKLSIGALPEAMAPQLFADVARDEMRLFPAEAVQDYTTAFTLARALQPAESETDSAGQAREQVKEQVEAAAVGALANEGHEEEALVLARLADVAKGPLYGPLIVAAARQADAPSVSSSGTPDPDAVPTGQKEVDAVFDLVQECKHADGTYPYQGVAAVLPRLGPLDRGPLTRDAYQWAGEETVPARMNAAVGLLRAGWQLAPELDGELEDTLSAMLQTLGQNGAAAPFAIGAGGRLMSLLTAVDPPRAEALAARFPNLGAPAMESFNLGGADGASLGNALTFSFAPPAALGEAMLGGSMLTGPLDSGEAAGAAQFAAIEEQAESLQRRDPGQALALANQAANLLAGDSSDTLWAAETVTAARLAQLYRQLGDNANSARILSRCLDTADHQARATDASYFAASSSRQEQIAASLQSAQAPAIEVYSLAARLDPAATAQRAEAAQFVLLKPTILLRVALVEAVGQPAARQ